LDLREAARQAIDGFHTCTVFEPSNGEVEKIELVEVGG
jgi:hypothetical protein